MTGQKPTLGRAGDGSGPSGLCEAPGGSTAALGDVPVIQADRDIAASIYGLYFAFAAYNPTGTCEQIRRGKYDMLFLVQAFARHRIKAAEGMRDGD